MKSNLFKSLSWITLFSVILLVGVGSIVRSSGSGMGCPDWPKCFGKWVPPLHASDLPQDLKPFYPPSHTPLPFNAVKTWTEYLNRLMGVTVGLLILGTFFASLPLKTQSYKPIIWSGIAVFLVGFEGWLGAVVVKTNLKVWVITGHLAVAWLLIFALQYARFSLSPTTEHRVSVLLRRWLIALFSLTLIQVFLGTQVRHAIDPFIAQLIPSLPRAQWAWQSGFWLFGHQVFSWLMLVSSCCFAYLIFQSDTLSQVAKKLSYQLLVMIILEIAVGIGLGYGGLPPYLQPVHLVLATLIVASEFQLLLLFSPQKKTRSAAY